jgi:hypothetical protein
MAVLKPPPWSADNKELATFFEHVIALPENDSLVDKRLRRFAAGTFERRIKEPRFDKLDQDAQGKATPLPTAEALEQAALKLALAGNFRPLANRLDHPRFHVGIENTEALLLQLLKQEPRDQDRIEATQEKLQRLREERRQQKFHRPGPDIHIFMADFLRGQRPSKRRGRPPSDDLFWTSKPYRAARFAELIEILLRKYYPKQKSYRERAISIAGISCGIKRSMIANQFTRGNKI